MSVLYYCIVIPLFVIPDSCDSLLFYIETWSLFEHLVCDANWIHVHIYVYGYVYIYWKLSCTLLSDSLLNIDLEDLLGITVLVVYDPARWVVREYIYVVKAKTWKPHSSHPPLCPYEPSTDRPIPDSRAVIY